MKISFFVTVAVVLLSSSIASAAEAGTTPTCPRGTVLRDCGCTIVRPAPRPVAHRAAPVRRVAARPAPVRTRTVVRTVTVQAPTPAPVERVVYQDRPVYMPAPQPTPAPRQLVPLTFSNVVYATPQRRAFQMPDVQMGGVNITFINQGATAPVDNFSGETKPPLLPPSDLPGVTPGVPTPNTPVPPPRPGTDFGGNTGGTTDGGVAPPRRNDITPPGTGGSTVSPVPGLPGPVTGTQNNGGLTFVPPPVQGLVNSQQSYSQIQGGYQVLPQPQQVLVFQNTGTNGIQNPLPQPVTGGQLVFLGQTIR